MVFMRFLAFGFLFLAISATASDSPTASEKQQQRPQWWKGCLHAHSFWSDGNDFPEVIAKRYEKLGYNFLAFTEHNHLQKKGNLGGWIPREDQDSATPGQQQAIDNYRTEFKDWITTRTYVKEKILLDTKNRIKIVKNSIVQYEVKPLDVYAKKIEMPSRFIMIPGEEVSNNIKGTDYPVHIIGINLQDDINPYENINALPIMEKNVREFFLQSSSLNPILAVVCHPDFWKDSLGDKTGLISTDQMAELTNQIPSSSKLFIEIFNGHPAAKNFGWTSPLRFSAEVLWDITIARSLLKAENPSLVYGVAGDDAHHYFTTETDKCNPGRAWVMVRANELTPISLLNAMNQGDFYSSTGVILKDVRVLGNKPARLYVEVDAEKDVSYRIRFIGVTKEQDNEKTLHKVETMRHSARLTDKDIVDTKAEYVFKGNELYVRATVISTKPMPNPPAGDDLKSSPYKEDDEDGKIFERAWTQPVIPPSNVTQ